MAWYVRSRIWTICGEKGSVSISYSEIQCGGIPPGTTMHGKREKSLWRQGPSIQKIKKAYESNASTASRCFSRFSMVAKRIMGVVRRQDKALMYNKLLLIGEIAE